MDMRVTLFGTLLNKACCSAYIFEESNGEGLGESLGDTVIRRNDHSYSLCKKKTLIKCFR